MGKRSKYTVKRSGLKTDTFVIKFVGGELDGRIQEQPLPKLKRITNKPFLNKSWWQKNPDSKDVIRMLETNQFYVAEKTCSPKSNEIIEYHFTPGFICMGQIPGPYFSP